MLSLRSSLYLTAIPREFPVNLGVRTVRFGECPPRKTLLSKERRREARRAAGNRVCRELPGDARFRGLYQTAQIRPAELATMNRRTLLQSAGAAAAAGGLAGCLGVIGLGDSTPNVVLPEPDRQFTSEQLPYPAWGQRVPDVSLPAIPGEEVSLRSVGEPMLVTFFYSHCQTVCPVLIGALRNIQAHAQNNGYAEAVSLHPITFDPARDTAERLRTYADEMNVAIDADSWQFLRPSSEQRAEAVVTDEFGVNYGKTHPDDMDKYMFNHAAMTMLVNGDGYVERTYRTKSPDERRLIDDLREVRTA